MRFVRISYIIPGIANNFQYVISNTDLKVVRTCSGMLKFINITEQLNFMIP